MRIFPRPLQIADTEGFTNEKDIFGRQELGSGLTNLVGVVTDPMVIAIDGQWGSGKSTFLKMWAGQLRQAQFPVIYFDAFENDYIDDAFMALAGEIIALVEAHKKSQNPKAKEFKDKAVGALKVVGRSALKVGVKAASMGALDAAKLSDELVEAVSNEAEDLTDKHIGELLTKQAESRSTLQGFRDALRDLPGILIPPSNPSDGDEGVKVKPLIFIIDELDRCKPNFALELLERIKHFFAVQNVHFVLGVHMGQLRNSVNSAYGININANTYLQKFISLTFPLVDHHVYRGDSAVVKYISHITNNINASSTDLRFVQSCADFVTNYALINSSSFRDIEHFMTNIALAAAFTNDNTLRPVPIVAGLSILRVSNPDLYIKAKLNKTTYDEISKALSLDLVSYDDSVVGYSDWDVSWWQYCLKQDIPDDVKSSFGNGLFRYNVRDRFSIVPLISRRVIDKLLP
ncbi:KAP family P-loop NTPase fold protein [Brevundimonas sp. GN22]